MSRPQANPASPELLFIHVVDAILWVGGMFFAYFCLRPAAAETLDPPKRAERPEPSTSDKDTLTTPAPRVFTEASRGQVVQSRWDCPLMDTTPVH